MKLNNNISANPLYVQLKEAIKRDINNGKYKIGAQLPTEAELCEMYGVSRITTRRAITELEEEGILKKQHGIGTFVTQSKIKRELFSINGFSEFLLQSGKTPRTKIISTIAIGATKWLAETLKIEDKDPVLEVRRLHLIDNEPIHLETSYYPLDRFPNLDKHLDESSSIYSILKDRYNVRAVKNDKTLNVTSPTIEQAVLLNCTQDIALYEVEKIAYSKGKVPIHYTLSFLPTSKVTFTITTDRE